MRPEDVVRRLIAAFASLAGLVVLTFSLLKELPGSPFEEETPLHPAVRESLTRAWALDQNLPTQFIAYLRTLADGSLGWSMAEPGRTVGSIIRDAIAATVHLDVLALAVVVVLGFLLGLWGSDARNSIRRRAFEITTVALTSLPGLFLGPVLIWIFALKFDWLPVAFLDEPSSYVLPVLTLALRPAAGVARLLAGALREARAADYMRTARAKGLSEGAALRKHALRNSWLPILGFAGPLVMGLVSSSFIVEVLFAIRGLGSFFVAGIENRDVPVVLGITMVYGVILIVVSALLDLMIFAVDPRLRETKA